MKIDRILDEYRQGDADRRLSLFLYHRGLRDEFTHIEEMRPGDLFESMSETKPARSGMFHRTFEALLNIVRIRPALRDRWTTR